MRSASQVRNRGCVTIHPTAIVHPDAELGDGVEVGPYAIIEANVRIGERTIIGPRVSIEGHTTIGSDNEFFTGAVIGSITQDKKYDGGISYLEIGSHNKIREYVTINPGTITGTKTVIGSHNLLMAYSHVAHDCVIHDHVIIANQGTLAGHVIVESGAIVGGLSAVHQFVRIGRLAIIGGCSKVVQDVPPFTMADGHPASARGINSVGMERADYSKESKSQIKKAFRVVFKATLTLKNAIKELEENFEKTPQLDLLVEFLKTSERGICR